MTPTRQALLVLPFFGVTKERRPRYYGTGIGIGLYTEEFKCFSGMPALTCEHTSLGLPTRMSPELQEWWI